MRARARRRTAFAAHAGARAAVPRSLHMRARAPPSRARAAQVRAASARLLRVEVPAAAAALEATPIEAFVDAARLGGGGGAAARCASCAGELDGGARFCESCGAPATAPTRAAAGAPAPAPAGDGALKAFLHARGVNLRYLGALRAASRSPAHRALLLAAALGRGLRRLVADEWRAAAVLDAAAATAVLARWLSHLLAPGEPSGVAWRLVLRLRVATMYECDAHMHFRIVREI